MKEEAGAAKVSIEEVAREEGVVGDDIRLGNLSEQLEGLFQFSGLPAVSSEERVPRDCGFKRHGVEDSEGDHGRAVSLVLLLLLFQAAEATGVSSSSSVAVAVEAERVVVRELVFLRKPESSLSTTCITGNDGPALGANLLHIVSGSLQGQMV